MKDNLNPKASDNTMPDILQLLQEIKQLLEKQQRQPNVLQHQNQVQSPENVDFGKSQASSESYYIEETLGTRTKVTEDYRNLLSTCQVRDIEKGNADPSSSQNRIVSLSLTPNQSDTITLDMDHKRHKAVSTTPCLPWVLEYESVPKNFKPTCSIDQIPDAAKLFGPAWSIPPDGRISLGFTKFELERTYLEDARMMVKGIVAFMNRLDTLKAPFGRRPGVLRVLDFDPRSSQHLLGPAEYILGSTNSSTKAEGSGNFRGESSHFKEQGMFSSQGSKLSAPWRRIIICEGFASAWSTNTAINPCYNFEPTIGCAVNPSIIDFHRHCLKGMPGQGATNGSGANQYRVFRSFHVTLFELCVGGVLDDLWNHGTLYPLSGSPFVQSFRECAFTVRTQGLAILHISLFFTKLGIYSQNGRYADIDASRLKPTEENNQESYWTMIILLPSKCWRDEFTFGSKGKLSLNMAGNQVSPTSSVFIIVSFILDAVLNRWQGLADIMDRILDHEEVSFMKPKEYVHLLYDDAAFSRSRFYFWAIGCLTAFDARILNNIKQFNQYHKAQAVYLLNYTRRSRNDVMVAFQEEFESNLSALEAIHDRFQDRLTTMESLRNGLFSACSVMESRQSRILGENIRLLTYVSIFFLPLAFSISLWTIPDFSQNYPGIQTPLIAAVVVGTMTYVIVFNLNLLRRTWHMGFSIPQAYLSRKMREEAFDPNKWKFSSRFVGPNWDLIGRRFEPFPRLDEDPKPTRWWLLIYVVKLGPRIIYRKAYQAWQNFFPT